MQQQPYHAGGCDWLAIWRRMYDEERDQAERATAPDFEIGADFWAGQAERFAAAARRSPQPDGFMRFLLPRLRPTDRLLDIGAGTGRYEALLARHVAEVLALEPSPAMCARLEQRLAEEQVAGVQVLLAGWPDADVPECDVAISAHVVYSVREIGPFLEKMAAVARRACFLYLAIQHPSSFISPFWERFHGVPRLPLPGALECLGALYQLGIPARMALVPMAGRINFPTTTEALEDIRFRLRFGPDHARDAQIHMAIDQLLERDSDGVLMPRNLLRQAAVIWWEREQTEE